MSTGSTKKSVQIYAAGRVIVVYRSALFCWSFSVDGRPVGKSYLTKELARRAAVRTAQARRFEGP